MRELQLKVKKLEKDNRRLKEAEKAASQEGAARRVVTTGQSGLPVAYCCVRGYYVVIFKTLH